MSVPATLRAPEHTRDTLAKPTGHTQGSGRLPAGSYRGNYSKSIYVWTSFFYDILDDEQLTGKLQNTIKKLTGAAEDENDSGISANLPERHSHWVRRRKRRTGKEFRWDTQNRNHELTSRRCATVRTVRWIGTELRDPPVFEGTTSVGDFLDNLEFKVPEEQRVLALDVALKGTSARWWAIHKENLTTWEEVQPAMIHRPTTSELKRIRRDPRNKGGQSGWNREALSPAYEAVEGKSKGSPPCNELRDRFIIPLLGLELFGHSNPSLCVAELLPELRDPYFPSRDRLFREVGVPCKGVDLQPPQVCLVLPMKPAGNETNLFFSVHSRSKFSSGRPSVDEIKPHVRTHWMMNSEVHIGLLDPRHVIMRFSSQEDFIQAWTRESLVIKAYYFKFLWSPWFDPRFESSLALLWISLPNDPLNFFNPDYLKSIAGVTGRVLRFDGPMIALVWPDQVWPASGWR
ncbi:putative ribonuclease h protein [Cinnamomum micranthum f. kanehirae]|uniref:Putative ribonuclease h protein n=1 Tax=Cinnamomum micranthum f. kanehirae TaxID=337451 RepID=A0A443Q4J8_9MAGN|nr:putative ribonuclease h protein [Cinnamomum micranthum f. kanehirae]